MDIFIGNMNMKHIYDNTYPNINFTKPNDNIYDDFSYYMTMVCYYIVYHNQTHGSDIQKVVSLKAMSTFKDISNNWFNTYIYHGVMTELVHRYEFMKFPGTLFNGQIFFNYIYVNRNRNECFNNISYSSSYISGSDTLTIGYKYICTQRIYSFHTTNIDSCYRTHIFIIGNYTYVAHMSPVDTQGYFLYLYADSWVFWNIRNYIYTKISLIRICSHIPNLCFMNISRIDIIKIHFFFVFLIQVLHMLESQYTYNIMHNTKQLYTFVFSRNLVFTVCHIQRQPLVTLYSTLIYTILCFSPYTNAIWNSKTINSYKSCQMINKTTIEWYLMIINAMAASWDIPGRASYIFDLLIFLTCSSLS